MRGEQVSTSTVFGIRHTADLEGEWADWVSDSVSLANFEAAKTGEAFLFDTVDVTQRLINGYKCWDMYGWVVPLGKLQEVEPLWLADDDESIDAYYASVSFKDGANAPVVSIDRS